MDPRAATPRSWEDEYDAEVAAEKAAGGHPTPDATIAFPSTSQLVAWALRATLLQQMAGRPQESAVCAHASAAGGAVCADHRGVAHVVQSIWTRRGTTNVTRRLRLRRLPVTNPTSDATLASRVPCSALLRQTYSGGHPCAWSTSQLIAWALGSLLGL
jgi:hypothetical protein